MKDFDIAVVGGGASGLSAAIEAKRRCGRLKTAVLERLPKVGKKLLATGNGRCNFTNREIRADRFRGSCVRFFPLLEQFDAEAFLRSLGVFGAADKSGRLYPVSGCASAVLDGLRLEARRLGVETICDFPVRKIQAGKTFTLVSEQEISARAVILAGGGLSQKTLGSDGSALELARSLGIRTRQAFPALVPLRTKPEAVRGLQGVRAGANAALYKNGACFRSETGEVQFGADTLSGVCIFNLSLWYDEGEKAEIRLDLLPEKSEEGLLKLLGELRSLRGGAALEDLLTGLLHKRIGLLLIRKETGRSPAKPAGELGDKELKQLAHGIKAMTFPILGTAGFEKSQVTRGGVCAEELSGSLEALRVPRLFLCGEMLDIAGECGGYNLSFAFASGAAAGRACAEALI